MGRRSVGSFLVVILLLGTSVAPVAAQTGEAGSTAAVQGEDRIVRTVTLSRTPAEPGSVRARLAFELPEQVLELTTGIPEGTVTATSGFEPDGTGNYTWDGETATPSVTVSLPANRTGTYHRAPAGADRGLQFVDTGDWAIVPIPTASVWWTYRGHEEPTFTTRTTVDGPGVAGRQMAFLGPHSTYTRQVGAQRVRLVVPEAATTTADPAAILDSLAAAGPFLPESPVTETVLIAAPTGVDWGPYGLAVRSDAWVRADQPLADPGNVWLHELVHLRQDFETTPETRWLREAIPEYYAAQLTLHQGRIDFGAFESHLDRGTRSRYDRTVLSRPETWDPLANYVKGGLVYGALDYRIRQVSDGEYSARHLFEAMNGHGEPIDRAFLEDRIERVGGADLVAQTRPYVTTTDTPTVWSRADHERVFGTEPADLTVSVDPMRISGPYRNDSVESVPPLVPGETLSIPLALTNEGGTPGSYTVTLTADGTPVANATGTLDPGESTRETLSYAVTDPGRVTLRADSFSWTIEALEVASPVVTAIDGPDGPVEVGEQVTVSVSIGNPRDRPAEGTLQPRIDGQNRDPLRVGLAPGETIERTVTVTFGNSGPHTVTVGDRSVTVQVRDRASTTRSPTRTTDSTAPGFGFGVGVLALVLGRAAAGRIGEP